MSTTSDGRGATGEEETDTIMNYLGNSLNQSDSTVPGIHNDMSIRVGRVPPIPEISQGAPSPNVALDGNQRTGLPKAAPASGFPVRPSPSGHSIAQTDIYQPEPLNHHHVQQQQHQQPQATSTSQNFPIDGNIRHNVPDHGGYRQYTQDSRPPTQYWDPFGGYAGPQLNRGQQQIQPSQNDRNNSRPQGLISGIYLASHESSQSSHSLSPTMETSEGSTLDGMSNSHSLIAPAPRVEASGPANPDSHAETLPSHILHMMDRDMYRIKTLLEHKRTLVSHLNAMSKSLRLGTHGVKKEKQERLLMLAKRLRNTGDVARLHSMRLVMDSEAPKELASSDAGTNTALGMQGSNGPDGWISSSSPTTASSSFAQPVRTGINGPSNALNTYSNNGQTVGTGGTINPLVNPGGRIRGELSFKISPYYQLGKMLRPPILFLKPHMRRRLVQTIGFQVNSEILSKPDSHVFLMCQEFIPQASDARPVYFPFYNEIELDDEVVNANTRGVRGVPGSARPVDLKPLLLKKNTRSHRLRITVIVSDQGERISDKSFAFGVYYGFKTPHEQMIEEIKNRPHIELNHTKNMAMKAASGDQDEDDGLVMSSDAVYSLKDNVMMTKITLPIRSKACEHIDCFDALSFIMLQDQAETWKCPVCNKAITWESLAVDDFFSEILKSAGPDVETVSIRKDGSWSLENGDSTDSESSDSDEDNAQPSNRKTSTAEVVDLLSDTDEESFQQNTGPLQNTHNPTETQTNQPQTSRNPTEASENGNSNVTANGISNMVPQGDGSARPQPQVPSELPQQPALEPHQNPPDSIGEPLNPQRVEDNPQQQLRPNQPPAMQLDGNSGTQYSANGPRFEIYETLRAFQKSSNLIFDNPLRLTGDLVPSKEQSSQTQLGYTPSKQQPTPPAPSPPKSISSIVPQRQEVPPQTFGNFNPQPSSRPAWQISRLINDDDDDDDDDDIIDLTGDD